MNPDYTLEIIRSSRKTIAVQISGPHQVTVRAPRHMPQSAIQDFLAQHRAWIEAHLEKACIRQAEQAALPVLTEAELRRLAEQAAAILPARAAYYAPRVGVSYGRITIRSQRTRWGSCSSLGNLNFNCLLMLCPPEVIDYVVVHELCHRKEMNHSPRFWAEVERVLPDYRAARKWLKDEGQRIIARQSCQSSE